MVERVVSLGGDVPLPKTGPRPTPVAVPAMWAAGQPFKEAKEAYEMLSDKDKRAAYGADITYGTNNEFGFDYLRDNMVFATSEKVQRKLAFAPGERDLIVLKHEFQADAYACAQADGRGDPDGRSNRRHLAHLPKHQRAHGGRAAQAGIGAVGVDREVLFGHDRLSRAVPRRHRAAGSSSR